MNDTLRQCGRCGRIEYAAEAQIDVMLQPDDQPCWGVFTLTTYARREQGVNGKLFGRLAAIAESRPPEEK